MRIAMISKADRFGGGASKVAEQLCQGLQAQGHEISHFVSWTRQGYQGYRKRLYGERWQRRFYRWSRALKSWFAPDVIPFEWLNLRQQLVPEHFDLVHVHDTSSAVSPLTVKWLAQRLPLVWTLHDCSAFTGGCLHPLTCTAYLKQCGQCPQHGRWPMDSRFDYSRLKHRLTHCAATRADVTLVSPSHWLRDKAQQALKREDIVHIVNGVDLDLYRPPVDKARTKAQWGLGQKPCILLAAADLDNPYKGLPLAVEALTLLSQGMAFCLLVVGQRSPEMEQQLAAFDTRFTGYLADEDAMASCYQAADVLLFPSIAENQPLQVLEAMASALPVVAFDTCGVSELIRDGETGWLAPRIHAQALAASLQQALAGDNAVTAGNKARAWVAQHHSLAAMQAGYLALYQQRIAHGLDTEG